MRSASLVIASIVLACLGRSVAVAQDAATGVVRADEAVIVRSEVAGIIGSIEVSEGQEVSEGEVLVQLRSEIQTIGVRLAEARLSRAEANVAASRVTLENARRTLVRVETAGTALTAKDREDVFDEVTRLEAVLRAQEAELSEARVEADSRQNALENTRVLAPFAGTVTLIRIQKGDTLVALETPILDLVNLDRLFVELALPVAEIPDVVEGRTVEVFVEEGVLGPRGRVEGVIGYVNPTVDPSSRTFLVKVDIADPSRRIRPGMRAEVRLR